MACDPCNYIVVPFCVVTEYYDRAIKSIGDLPFQSRYSWLRQRDTEERTVWSQKYRETRRPLGKIIKETMIERETLWMVDKLRGGSEDAGLRSELNKVKQELAAVKRTRNLPSGGGGGAPRRPPRRAVPGRERQAAPWCVRGSRATPLLPRRAWRASVWRVARRG